MEIIKLIKKTASGRTSIVETVYFNDDTNSKSRASYVLLKEQLKVLDIDYIAENEARQKIIEFSRAYLTEQQKNNNGNLICSYCKKSHLIIEYDGMLINNKIKATIDHIVAISKGGEIYNPDNICVACGSCNSKKSNMSEDEFRKRYNFIIC